MSLTLPRNLIETIRAVWRQDHQASGRTCAEVGVGTPLSSLTASATL